jgi:hypothetical protein
MLHYVYYLGEPFLGFIFLVPKYNDQMLLPGIVQISIRHQSNEHAPKCEFCRIVQRSS